MLVLGSGLVLSGLLMIKGQAGEMAEEVHEWCGNGFLILAGTHVAGVLIHLLRKKDGIAFSMVDGKKSQDTLGPGIPDARPISGLLLALSLIGLATGIYRSYDSPARTLKIAGFTLVLGEAQEQD
jgi:hypothetical protein